MVEAETVAPPRLPKPESLEAKFNLLKILPYDARIKRRHSAVYAFLVDWYHSKYGDALASVRHIVGTLNTRIRERDPRGKIFFAGDVHGALVDLVDWGYLSQVKGAGRRASRYVPVWDFVCSVRETPNTTISNSSVRETPNADVRETPNTTADSVRETPNEDPSTLTRSQDPGTGKDDIDDSAAPVAPPVSGLTAATAGPAEEFEQLYKAYGVRKNRVAAEAVFKDLALPIGELVAAAKTWRAAAGEGTSRMYLDRWLREKRYDEDPPTKFEPKPGKVKMPRKRVGAVRRDAEIAEIIGVGGFGHIEVELRWFDRQEGEPESSTIRLYGDDYAYMLRDLSVTNPDDAQFRRVLVDLHTAKDGTETKRWHRYPDAANDDLPKPDDGENAIRCIAWREAA